MATSSRATSSGRTSPELVRWAFSDDGVFLAEGASSNWIGVNPSAVQAIHAEGNVISGNGNDGVQIYGSAIFNVVAGNKIGTDVTGTVALGNSSSGVEVDAGCSGNTIGGTTAGAGNVISANGNYRHLDHRCGRIGQPGPRQ